MKRDDVHEFLLTALLLGVIALVLVGMKACSDGGGGSKSRQYYDDMALPPRYR